MKNESKNEENIRSTNASPITVTGMPYFLNKKGEVVYPNGIEYFHPQSGMTNGTLAENNGTYIENSILDFYENVFGEHPTNKNKYFYNLFGAKRTGGSVYHAGVDIYNGTYRKPVKSAQYGVVVYCDRNVKGAVGIYNEHVDKTFYYLHMIIDDKIYLGKEVLFSTVLGLQSNVGADDDHLHFEVHDGEHRTGPAGTPNVNGTLETISPYPYM